MTPDFSELTALEKSKTSTPIVIELGHSLAPDEKSSNVEDCDRTKNQSSLDKDDFRALSSHNSFHNLGPILF